MPEPKRKDAAKERKREARDFHATTEKPPPPGGCAVLEKVARDIAWQGSPTGLAVAHVLCALAKALAKDDAAELNRKGGPEAWARAYGSRYDSMRATVKQSGRADVSVSGMGMPFTWGKDRRLDRPSFLRSLVEWFQKCEHATDADRAFWVAAVLCMNELAIGPTKHRTSEELDRAIEHELGKVNETLTPREIARRRARAAMRGWGWSAREVDDSFSNV